MSNNQLDIVSEGKMRKFLDGTVEHVTFSGAYAAKRGQRALYITERCVFELDEGGLILTEIAPGIELERDILALMDFTPRMTQPLPKMDRRIFNQGIMGLKQPNPLNNSSFFR